MPVSAAYKSFIQDLLADFGPVSIRRMFSGAGVYTDGVMFAILADVTLYLKADEVSARDFAAEGRPLHLSSERPWSSRSILLGGSRTAARRP